MARRLEGRGAVEVYINPTGQVVIKQESPMGDEDPFVVVDAHDVPTIIKWLREVAKEAKDFRPAASEEETEQ